jgi:competence protein ComEA
MRTLVRPIALAAFVLSAPFLSAQPAKKAADKPAAQAAAPKPAGKPEAPATAKGAQIDINTATTAELEAFPGIGKAIAGKIIAGRPYTSKAQLVQKKILTQKAYDAIKDKLIAKQ